MLTPNLLHAAVHRIQHETSHIESIPHALDLLKVNHLYRPLNNFRFQATPDFISPYGIFSVPSSVTSGISPNVYKSFPKIKDFDTLTKIT